MNKMLKRALPIGLLLIATSASAGIKQGEFSVSPVIGGYTFDGRQDLDTTLVFGGRVGYMFTKHFGIEGLFDYVNPEITDSKKKDITMYRYGGDLLYHFFPDNKFVPYIAAGAAAVQFDGKGTNNVTYASADYGLGAKYFITDRFAMRADVRHIMYDFGQTVRHNLEYTLGVYIPFGGKADPVKPVAQPAPVAAPAPPPPPAVPTALLHANPQSITSGQQTNLQWSSTNADKCYIWPGIGAVGTTGSMAVSPTENADYRLVCSGEGGEATSNASVAVAAPVQEMSAAKAALVHLCNPTVLEVQFDTDKANIKPQYHAELNRIGEFMKEFPEAMGSIDGHTDSTGSKAYNMKLSQRRADSVRDYLIKNEGVDASRIKAKGYGPDKPIATNKTAGGRKQNRRIEANFTCGE